MLRTTIGFLVGVAALSAASPAFAEADSAVAETQSTLTIAVPIAIEKKKDLQFGRIAMGTTGSNTVTITTAGERSITGEGNAVEAAGTITNASYTVTGQTGETFSIQTTGTFNLTSTDGTIPVTLDLDATTGTVTEGGTTFNVGGHFDIDNTTVKAGAYAGTFNITVQYN